MTIPIMVCTDKNYLACSSVMILSICRTASPDTTYDIYVIMEDIDKEAEKKYTEMTSDYPNVSIRFVSVSEYTNGHDFYTENRVDITEAAYYRLYIPYLFPQFDKAVYLDGDVIVKIDIAELYNIPLDEMVGAVRDYLVIGIHHSNTTDSKDYYTNYLNFTDNDNYFNSGVLLMNLQLFRERFSAQEMMNIASSKKWRNHDQDILNVICQNSKKLLPANWNVLEDRSFRSYLPKELADIISLEEKEPYIIHFNGLAYKPWKGMGMNAIKYFWPLAQKSPWYIDLAMECLENAPQHLINLQYFTYNITKKGNPKESTKALISYNNQRLLTLELIKHLLPATGKALGDSEEEIAQRIALVSRTNGNPNALVKCLPKRRLSFEIDIADHCNLNCRYCAHFSSVSEEHFADLDETKRSFERLSELSGGEVRFIHLLGGEPLLNSQVTDFAIAAREAFPIGKIDIITNGILLMSMPENFWKVCHDYSIQISISNYPLKLPMDDIKSRARQYDVKCTYFGNSDIEITNFIKYTMDPEGGANPEESFFSCFLASGDCVTLRNGRLYPCSTAGCINRFSKRFGEIIPETSEDSIDIFEAKNTREILNFLSKPIPMCRYCDVKNRTKNNPWSYGKDAGEITEWLRDDYIKPE
ncbi:MAG: radical SAM protein [Erysipelotrichaceae bacterium]|nr:radical SAM protein [Erysipelotrichaceae bacterium]